MTLIFGIHAVQAKLNAALTEATLWIDQNRKDPRITRCIAQAKTKHITIKHVDKATLTKMTTGNHQGVVLEYTQSTPGNEKSLYTFLAELDHDPLLLVLDGVTDPHNLGACLRTANGAGVDAVITPKDKAAGLSPTAIKVASGAAETTAFFQVTNLARVLRQLADNGVWLIGTDDKAEQNIYDIDYAGKIALILGNEGTGLRRLTKEICQQLVYIPMQGTVSSLNVSVAAGVGLYEAYRQRKK